MSHAFASTHFLNPPLPKAENYTRPTLVWDDGGTRFALTFADRADALAHLSAAMEAVHALTPAADDLPVMP